MDQNKGAKDFKNWLSKLLKKGLITLIKNPVVK